MIVLASWLNTVNVFFADLVRLVFIAYKNLGHLLQSSTSSDHNKHTHKSPGSSTTEYPTLHTSYNKVSS